MTTMEACHRASDRQRLQLLKQKHPSRQDDWGGEPAVMDGEWLWKETFLTWRAWLGSCPLCSLDPGLSGSYDTMPTFEDRQLEKEKSVGVKKGRGTGKSSRSDSVLSLMAKVPYVVVCILKKIQTMKSCPNTVWTGL